jgi:hypothetical protein
MVQGVDGMHRGTDAASCCTYVQLLQGAVRSQQARRELAAGNAGVAERQRGQPARCKLTDRRLQPTSPDCELIPDPKQACVTDRHI